MTETIAVLSDIAEALATGHFDGPPVDPFELAGAMGVEVVLQADDAAHWRTVGGRGGDDELRVVLPAAMYPERQRFRLAHELVEVAGAQGEPPVIVPEEFADRSEFIYMAAASAMMMPREWYAEAGSVCEWDLAYLKELFEVSWEAAARRVPACTEATATVIDNGSVTVRVSSPDLACPQHLMAEEKECVQSVYDEWPAPDPQVAEANQFTCRAWPALPEQNAIRRVCLLTFPMEWW